MGHLPAHLANRSGSVGFTPSRRQEAGDKNMKPMSSRRTFFGTAAGAAALACLPRRTTAQDAYPTRPVHVVVGFTPGTAADITARVVANGAGASLGQQIVIENKP